MLIWAVVHSSRVNPSAKRRSRQLRMTGPEIATATMTDAGMIGAMTIGVDTMIDGMTDAMIGIAAWKPFGLVPFLCSFLRGRGADLLAEKDTRSESRSHGVLHPAAATFSCLTNYHPRPMLLYITKPAS